MASGEAGGRGDRCTYRSIARSGPALKRQLRIQLLDMRAQEMLGGPCPQPHRGA